MSYVERNSCRIDDSRLEEVLDFGSIYPSNFVTKDNSKVKVPLVLCKGSSSNLVQLKHTMDRDLLYRNYWYRSELNSSMVESLKDVVRGIERRIKVFEGDVVVDIGANDGTMLSMFPKYGITVGFDPANNLKDIASTRCTHFINDYFSVEKYPLNKKAKIITSIAMFYDLEDPNTFVEDVRSILDKNGLWIIQLTDLLSMMKVNAFDNIVHEHLEYYSLEVLCKLMQNHGLDVFDVEFNNVNGGSIRAYIGHSNFRYVGGKIDKLLKNENDYMWSFGNPWTAFTERVENIKKATVDFIKNETKKGKVFYGMGASTKGNTLLQYFNLTPDDIIAIAEVNKDKYGLKTIGTGIPIISEADALKAKPDYFLVLPWHFIGNFVDRNQEFLNNGGSFIVPCPVPAVISKDGKKWI